MGNLKWGIFELGDSEQHIAKGWKDKRWTLC